MENFNDDEFVPPDSKVVDILVDMFGEVMDRDAIISVVDSCAGDLTNSTEALMQISTEQEIYRPVNPPRPPPKNTQKSAATEQTSSPNDITEHTNSSPKDTPAAAATSTMSYAAASTSTGAIPKTNNKRRRRRPHGSSPPWNEQIKRIIQNHNIGYCTVIIMRGVPGSGKSYLAKLIVEMTVGADLSIYESHIFSTDDYFMRKNGYIFDKALLTVGHFWNQSRVQKAFQQGLSPVIVDNTHIETWEMEPYVKAGYKEGYIVEIVEPDNAWVTDAYILSKKNVHQVPLPKIKKMLGRFKSMSNKEVLNACGIDPARDTPPRLRKTPVIEQDMSDDVRQKDNSNGGDEMVLKISSAGEISESSISNEVPTGALINVSQSDNTDVKSAEKLQSDLNVFDERNDDCDVVEKFSKLEKDWDMGEDWVEVDSKGNSVGDTVKLSNSSPKSKREFKRKEENELENKLLPNVTNEWNDWQFATQLIPPWNPELPSTSSQYELEHVKETISASTEMEKGDWDINNAIHLVINTTPRDINISYVPKVEEKIPDRRMLDKGSMTDELLIKYNYDCKNKDKHYLALRNMFKNIAHSDLKDIFEKCSGDLNWAVDMVLDGVSGNETQQKEDSTETEASDEEPCDCIALYSETPDNISSCREPTKAQHTASLSQHHRKFKKCVSENSLLMKKFIEAQVAFGINHYSKKCLKIFNARHPTAAANVPPKDEEDLPNDVDVENLRYNEASNHPQEDAEEAKKEDEAHAMPIRNNSTSSDESATSGSPTEEKTIYLGKAFVNQIDTIFGRHSALYAEEIQPIVSMPVSLLNEINAIWLESLTHQVTSQESMKEILLKEDQDFAEQLAAKEAELSELNAQDEVPDFKEIMDMDFAISLHLKEVSDWKSRQQPQDMAARMSREKLQNLFPEMHPDVLSEMLMAHDNNFHATVEVLLNSTGQGNLLQGANSVAKFIMDREMARHQEKLQEEQKELENENWPVLTEVTTPLDMATVHKYRETARSHLDSRNMNLKKAKSCVYNSMTRAASYYSDVAAYHKRRFEHSNTLAATSLIQVQAQGNPCTTLDLHFLHVSEALAALDLFLDYHITRASEKSRERVLYVITGRGLHSRAGPRIKPAVTERLAQRELKTAMVNPGLISVFVDPEDKLSHQLEN